MKHFLIYSMGQVLLWYQSQSKHKKTVDQSVRSINYNQVGLVPGMQGWINVQKSINVIYDFNTMKEKSTWSFQLMKKNHLTTQTMMKTINKVGKKRELSQPDKGICEKLAAKIIFIGEKLKLFP